MQHCGSLDATCIAVGSIAVDGWTVVRVVLINRYKTHKRFFISKGSLEVLIL